MVIDLSPVLHLTFIVMAVVSNGSNLSRSRIRGRHVLFFQQPLSPLNPELSQNNFDVMVVLTVLTGRTKLIVKN